MTDDYLTPLYGRREFQNPAPKTKIPDSPMLPESAHQLIKGELHLDGSPALNLATFVNTWMDEWATKLALDNINKNYIDHEEYPQSNLIEKRIIRMLGEWYGTEFAPGDADPDTAQGFYGSATIGSSEAVMLGLIAHRKAWQKNNKKNPQRNPLDRPFVLMSTHIHTCWDKFCKYYDAGVLYIPMTDTKFTIGCEDVAKTLSSTIADSDYYKEIMEMCEYSPDDPALKTRTVGELVMAVGCTVGTTLTGNSDDVTGAGGAITDYINSHPGLSLDIPIHVDAASGGFILPFTNSGTNDILFDFKSVERVKSINVSNHKFGLTYPGMGSVIFRDANVVDPKLIYKITYLGGNFYDYTVNFSRGAAPIILQYYNFLRLGLEGYKIVETNNVARAKQFVLGVEQSKVLGNRLQRISDQDHYPIVVFKWTGEQNGAKALSDGLRKFGWIMPAYKLPTNDPENPNGIDVMRVVVRQNISADKLALLITDMETVVGSFQVASLLDRPRRDGKLC